MKYYYNKAQPNIEYGMLSSRSLNNPKRKPNTNGLVTYYYTSVEEPRGGEWYSKQPCAFIPRGGVIINLPRITEIKILVRFNH